MTEERSDKIPFYVAGLFAAALCVLHPLGAFRAVDNKWIDQLFRWRGMEAADSRITLVAIDDESIKKIGHYPWPRSVYPKLFSKLFADGVNVVGIDVIFPDPSYPAEDKALVDATAKWGPRVVHSIYISQDAGRYSFRFPFPALKTAGKSFGVVNQMTLDSDGLIRQTFLMYGTSFEVHRWATDAERHPSLGLMTLAVYEGRPVDDYVGGRSIIHLNTRGELNTYGNHGEILSTSYGIPRVSAIDVLEGKLKPKDRARLKGGIVLVGSTAVGAFDHYPSAFSQHSPGAEVHLTVIDNLLNGRELHGITPWRTLIIVLAFAFFSAWTLSLSPLMSALVVIGALAAWITGNLYAFKRFWTLQFTAPTLALLGPFIILLIRRTLVEYQEKRFIKQTFGQFVAPEVVDDLIKDPSKIKLGGEKREMSVFFLDIAHFTTISEKMAAEALIQFLNRYLSNLSGVVQKRMGVVDKYIGDCIMAFWNAPLEQKDHRTLACLAAIECQEKMKELNLQTDISLVERPSVRIGVNSGMMTVGLTGSERKLQYTVIGDEVNLASRLEGANKFFGSRIMVSESCYSGAKDAVEARELGRIRVVGKEVPIRVFELLARKGELSDAWKKALPVYEKGIELYGARKFKEAKEKFEQVLKLVPGDGPSKTYVDIVEPYISIPPPKEWDGVINLREK